MRVELDNGAVQRLLVQVHTGQQEQTGFCVPLLVTYRCILANRGHLASHGKQPMA